MFPTFKVQEMLARPGHSSQFTSVFLSVILDYGFSLTRFWEIMLAWGIIFTEGIIIKHSSLRYKNTLRRQQVEWTFLLSLSYWRGRGVQVLKNMTNARFDSTLVWY